ncbi:MAG TPA: hypothetical protein VFK32_07785 [Tepidiformaceae bacterium]|nr:hypothetical protein [Tepidiformaceae bacterium]
MSQVLDLVTLQSIDDAIASAEASIASAEARIASDPLVDDARLAVEAAEEVHRTEVREQKRLEAEIARLNDRIVPEEKRLYSGEVKSPKELASIQHEVDHLKGLRAGHEEELFACLSRIEAADAALLAARATLAAEEARWSADRTQLESDLVTLRAHHATKSAERSAQAARVTLPSLQLYDLVRKRKGMAVAHVQGQSCSACRISIPESLRKRAMSPVAIAQCPSCDRILYVG